MRSHTKLSSLLCMAGTTGLEPATSAVTGQRSNQLSYVPKFAGRIQYGLCRDSYPNVTQPIDFMGVDG
jgi:hypothetical protein